MKVFGLVRMAIILGVALALCMASCNNAPPETGERSSTTVSSAVPAVPAGACFITVKSERGKDGEIYLVGSTNLPEGFHIGAMLLNGAHRPRQVRCRR